jgi:hypothetical protein
MGNGAANQRLGVRHIAHILGGAFWQGNEGKPKVAGHLRFVRILMT